MPTLSFGSVTQLFEHAVVQVLPWYRRPVDLPGCLLWLRASLGVVAQDGDVVTWKDQTGKHTVNAPQPGGRPKQLDHVADLNGFAGVGFYGSTTQALEKVGDIQLPFGSGDFSLFAVVTARNQGISNATIAMWSGSMPHVGMRLNSLGEFQGYLENFFDSGESPQNFKAHLLALIYSSGTLRTYVNGALQSTHAGITMYASNTGPAARLTIGGDTMNSHRFTGHIGDIAAYGRALTDAERDYITLGLLTYYEIYRRIWFSRAYQLLVEGVKNAASRSLGLAHRVWAFVAGSPEDKPSSAVLTR